MYLNVPTYIVLLSPQWPPADISSKYTTYICTYLQVHSLTSIYNTRTRHRTRTYLFWKCLSSIALLLQCNEKFWRNFLSNIEKLKSSHNACKIAFVFFMYLRLWQLHSNSKNKFHFLFYSFSFVLSVSKKRERESEREWERERQKVERDCFSYCRRSFPSTPCWPTATGTTGSNSAHKLLQGSENNRSNCSVDSQSL
jgi:hypothetical protein